MIGRDHLKVLYLEKKLSMQQIASELGCSLHKVTYWMARYRIPRRSISDAIYQHHNPDGDPFKFKPPETTEDHQLFGLGIGLYWGEGTKANLGSVRLGNSDPNLIQTFIRFLVRFFQIDPLDLKFGLQIFHDQQLDESVVFWQKRLGVGANQFYKPTVTQSVGKGIYRKKTKYGVLTIYYHNVKLRNQLVGLLPT